MSELKFSVGKAGGGVTQTMSDLTMSKQTMSKLQFSVGGGVNSDNVLVDNV